MAISHAAGTAQSSRIWLTESSISAGNRWMHLPGRDSAELRVNHRQSFRQKLQLVKPCRPSLNAVEPPLSGSIWGRRSGRISPPGRSVAFRLFDKWLGRRAENQDAARYHAFRSSRVRSLLLSSLRQSARNMRKAASAGGGWRRTRIVQKWSGKAGAPVLQHAHERA